VPVSLSHKSLRGHFFLYTGQYWSPCFCYAASHCMMKDFRINRNKQNLLEIKWKLRAWSISHTYSIFLNTMKLLRLRFRRKIFLVIFVLCFVVLWNQRPGYRKVHEKSVDESKHKKYKIDNDKVGLKLELRNWYFLKVFFSVLNKFLFFVVDWSIA